MEALFTGAATLLLVFLYLGLGAWVFSGLMLVSVTSLYFLVDFPLDRIGAIVQPIVWRSASAWELAAIPMFVWMGEIIFRTDISERLFRGLSPLADAVPGRLLHTNVAGCALFAAVSGSSAATTATVGKITATALTRLNSRSKWRLSIRPAGARSANPCAARAMRRASRLDRSVLKGSLDL